MFNNPVNLRGGEIMRKVNLIVIMLVMSVALSACYFPYPTNVNGTEMVAGKTITGFGIAGENLSGFEWYLDGELLTEQTLSVFFYIPGIKYIGKHELIVDFYQNGISQSWTWKINVAEPPMSLSENTEEQLDGE
jgi:hypothetical protein